MSSYLPTIFGENLMDVFDDFDRNFFRNFGNMDRALYGKHAQNMMKTDVKETDEGYEVDIDLPGFKKDEIQLELNNGYLTISTQKALEKDEKNKKGRMLRQERYAGMMQRSFYVG
ncbi:MAG TPA: Hsp20/alpha crystallin family protein, partial [Candidatus Faecaligallichristensenella faecipullorum]|nr:Hsp20/alpha crystallin family protein [Candidatus Faecaligallichristensenella faecipullorum]